MAKWTFEPGHTAAEFRARHMMVTYVRGHFKTFRARLNSTLKIQAIPRSKYGLMPEESGPELSNGTIICAAQIFLTRRIIRRSLSRAIKLKSKGSTTSLSPGI